MTALSCYLLQHQTTRVQTFTWQRRSISTAHKLILHSALNLPKFDPLSLDSLRYDLARLADVNKVVYVALVDDAFTDMAMNLYLTSFKRFDIKNYLFVAMDSKCCLVLSSKGVNCLHYISEYSDGQNASVYYDVPRFYDRNDAPV